MQCNVMRLPSPTGPLHRALENMFSARVGPQNQFFVKPSLTQSPHGRWFPESPHMSVLTMLRTSVRRIFRKITQTTPSSWPHDRSQVLKKSLTRPPPGRWFAESFTRLFSQCSARSFAGSFEQSLKQSPPPGHTIVHKFVLKFKQSLTQSPPGRWFEEWLKNPTPQTQDGVLLDVPLCAHVRKKKCPVSCQHIRGHMESISRLF